MLAEELGEGVKFKVYHNITKPDADKTFIIQTIANQDYHSWTFSNVDLLSLVTCVLKTLTPEQVKSNKDLKAIFDIYKEKNDDV